MASAMEVKHLSAFLENIGIGTSSAESFADALFDDGWETPEALKSVTLEELQNDYGFKRGHLRMIGEWLTREKKTESSVHVEDGVQEINEDHFTKYAMCYHHSSWGGCSKLKGIGEGLNIVEQAMIEVLENDTYIGFTHNEKMSSVYLLKNSSWKGIDDESIGCEGNPIPEGLKKMKTKTSKKWKWHSLYIKK